jgi:ATP-binding cassette subfamily F protein uup
MSLVSGHLITYSTNEKTLFRDLTFAISPGDRIGLVGPNGAGKSTLVKIILQKLKSETGTLAHQRGLRVGFLEQTPEFNPEDTLLSALTSENDDPDVWTKAYEWIAKLNLSQFPESTLIKDFSGGWRKRVALARELMKSPDFLVLDEPTNHLDVQSIMWLEDFLSHSNFAFLVVTHDRLFLQRVVNKIWDLDPKNPNFLFSSEGDYANYVLNKKALLDSLQRQEQVLKNTLRRETEWLRRGAIARQTKQKARINQAETLKDTVEDLSQRNRNQSVGISFAESEKNAKKLIDVQDLSKSFDERVLFENLNLIVKSKDRIALMGENGSGKSTLLRILLDQDSPSTGTVMKFEKLEFSYFEQGRDTLQPELSVLKNIVGEGDYVKFQGSYVHVNSYLERFLFFGNKVNLPVKQLSGGEQARLRIAQMMLKDSQILILDEPTNDLDVETLTVLQDALESFPGAVILVTHDRYFMDQVAQKILAFPPTGSPKKEILTFADFEQWETWYLQEKEWLQSSASRATSGSESANAKGKTKLSFKEKFELEKMEETILGLEKELAVLQIEISRSEVISNSSKLIELSEKIQKLQIEIEKKYDRWAILNEKSKA